MRRRSFFELACATGLSAGWKVPAFAESELTISIRYARTLAQKLVTLHMLPHGIYKIDIQGLT
jgi:hypothetical protein